MNVPAGDGGSPIPSGSPEGLQPAVSVVMPGHAEPMIYDVARVAGVAPSTVSRGLSKPGRVSYKTAEHVRQVAEQLGYRTGRRAVSERGTGMLGIIVADIANPVLFVMIRGAGPKASWADGVRRRSLRQAGVELDVQVRRLGPFPPTMRGGATAAEHWLPEPSTAVITYNDLMAIGFIHTVMAAGRSVPRDVSVVGFDNIVDSLLVEPQLRTIAPP